MDTLEAKDKVLKAIEAILNEIVRKENLQKASITLWRWEQPDIELRWFDREMSLWKNIHLLVGNGGIPYLVAIDINAWIDVDKDKSRERHLKSASSGKYKVADLEPKEVAVASKEPIRSSYESVKGWKRSDLKPATGITTRK